MQYLFLAAVIAYLSYRYVRRRRNKKRKAELTENVNSRLLQIDKHIEMQKMLFDCFVETGDLHYVWYGTEELKKANKLVKLNDLDIESKKRL